MQKLLSQKVAQSARHKSKPYQIHDTAIPGLVLRVQPTGAKIWKLIQDRQPQTLGRFPVWTFEMAKGKAERILRGEEEIEERKPMTFSRFVEKHYAPWVRANHSRPAETLRILNYFGMGEILLEEIRLADVETWRLKRQQKGRSPTTINRQTAVFRAALQKAVDWELLDAHPLARLKLLKTDRRKIVRYLKPGEEKRLMVALKARDDQKRAERESANQWRRERGHDLLPALGTCADNLTPLVILALNTGLRRGELWNLTWGDIDLRRKMLTVHGSGAKSKQTRHIPLNAAAVDALKTHRGDVAPLPSNPVFGRAEFKKAWAGVLEKAKIQKFRFHDCRHHFGSRLAMNGVPLNTIRELLGHQSIDMVLRYSHLTPDNLRAAVELI